ncbi:hypothetical protein M2317_000691 [Microbacterium sp. ZKA21]|jgi:hypothetical protein
MPADHIEHASMRTAFWAWTVIIVGGLAIMICLPLVGR